MSALALRLALLLSTAALAGIGLTRTLTNGVGTRTRSLAWSASAIAAVSTAVSLPILHLDITIAVVQLVLTLALPVLLRWSNPPGWTGFALLLLALVETALGHTGWNLLADAIYVLAAVAWLGSLLLPDPDARLTTNVRTRTIAVVSGGIVVLTGIAQVAVSGLAFDRRLHSSPLGLALLLLVLLPLVATALVLLERRGRSLHGRTRIAGVAAIAVTFSVWGALPALPKPPPLPSPGVPLLAGATLADKPAPLLVTPQRPGRNLVHFPESAGEDLSVRTENGHTARATHRPGSDGTWAELDLPSGRGELTVQRGPDQDDVEFDTGTTDARSDTETVRTATQPTSLPAATGKNGPECASAALGGLVAGQRQPLATCPSDRLSSQDADALRGLVRFLGTRSAPGITLAGDHSPRSDQANTVIRAAAMGAGIPVDTPHPGNALIVTSGWEDAANRLGAVSDQQAEQNTYSAGVHLAPWLMHAPVVNRTLTSFLPLPFNPRDQQALRYAVNVENEFGGETPSKAGFDAWLSTRRETPASTPVLYASAQVSAMPMNTSVGSEGNVGMGMANDHSSDYPGQWVSGGTVVPVTGALETD